MNPSIPAVAVALALAAQQQTQPGPRFKSSADLVQVDVSVVDGNGRPIRDLTADDFELRVDGRRRAIASAQFVAVGSNIDMPASPPAHYSSNAGAVGGRLVMIVVDRGSIAAGRGKAAFEAASRFVARLNRADRVALASIPEGPQVDFTANHALVQERLRHVDGEAVASLGPRSIGIADALAFERRDQSAMDAVVERECGGAFGGSEQRAGGGQSDALVCRNQVKSEALLVAFDARDRARNSVLGLRAILDRLSSSATPKILVLISEGFVLDREYAQISWLEARAAAAHVTVFALHLEPSELDASRIRPPARAAADRVALEEGLDLVTQATRGDVFRVIANSDFAFQRLALELSGYYLLGFEPEARDRNERPHEIKVEVRRKGVTVRSRRQFTITPAPVTSADSDIVAALRDPLPATDIPIKLTTFSFRDSPARPKPLERGEGLRPSRLRLLVAAEIDRSINAAGRLSIGFVLVDFDGKLAASQLDTALPPPALDNGRTQRYFSAVQVDPGKYTLKLVAVDDAGRRGSVERVVRAQLNAVGPIRATDLLVADDAAAADGGRPLAPAVSSDFTGRTLHGYLELFADAPETLDVATVTLEVAAAETSPALERAAVPLRTIEEDAGCRIAGGGVSIAGLAPGDYVARAVIAVGGRHIGQVSRQFRIQNSESRIQKESR